MNILRTGRHNGRTLYEQTGDEPSRDDVMVGTMDTPELASEVVEAVNRARQMQAWWATAAERMTSGEGFVDLHALAAAHLGATARAAITRGIYGPDGGE